MDLYMDEKWKLSKKSSRSRREQSSSSSSSSMASSSSGAAGSGSYLKRSSSMPESVKAVRRGPSSAAPSPRSFSSRCANLVKEQRAKFYIMRRCVTMLICWRDYP